MQKSIQFYKFNIYKTVLLKATGGAIICLSFFISLNTLAANSSQPDQRWLKMMRYNATLFGFESEVDSKEYFLSPKGKTNPQAELLATKEKFQEKFSDYKDPNFFPICMFPGRYLYLKKYHPDFKINFDLNKCPEYRKYQDKIDLKSISIIFSSYFINKPASAFGHTLLKFNSKKDSDFFSYGVDFSAQVTTKNPLIYGIAGIMGGFDGRFSLMPYFLKMREYNDFESRDLWEFELNLSKEEVEFAIAHLWDMNFAKFDYFYFTENCSYHVLRFIDAVSPKYNMMDSLYTIVAPLDTLFPLVNNPSLLKNIYFRPSLQKRLMLEMSKTNQEEFLYINKSLEQKKLVKSNLNKTKKAHALDVLSQFIDYKYAKELHLNLKDDDSIKIQDFKREILIARSELPESLEKRRKLKRESIDLGHKSRKFTIRSLWHKSQTGLNLQNRTALHNALERNGDIFTQFSLEMGKIDLDFINDDIIINKAEIANVLALRPVSLIEKTFSWDFSFGAGSTTINPKVVSPYINLGMGYSKRLLNTLAYLTLDSSFKLIGKSEGDYRVGPKYRHFFYFDKFRFSISAAYFKSLDKRFENNDELRKDYNEYQYNGQYSLNKNILIEFSGILSPIESRSTLGLSLFY